MLRPSINPQQSRATKDHSSHSAFAEVTGASVRCLGGGFVTGGERRRRWRWGRRGRACGRRRQWRGIEDGLLALEMSRFGLGEQHDAVKSGAVYGGIASHDPHELGRAVLAGLLPQIAVSLRARTPLQPMRLGVGDRDGRLGAPAPADRPSVIVTTPRGSSIEKPDMPEPEKFSRNCGIHLPWISSGRAGSARRRSSGRSRISSVPNWPF
jgi:hypothetical protein